MCIKPFYFLNVFKPKGITSFDVIYKLRKLLNIKQIGHSGTLDPMAEGVMQVAVGKAARLLEYLPSDKEYTAEIQFGYKSTTLDLEGEITESAPANFTQQDLIQAMENFKGKITQTPPIYSAIKVNGKKLCNIARKNPKQEIEIPKREVEIYKLELLYYEASKAKIRVCCSKGTYIRTLASDIAVSLGTDAYLTKLERTKIGNFEIQNSVKIDEINPKLHAILPQNALFFPKYEISPEEFKFVKNGNPIKNKTELKQGYISLIYKNFLVSIGVLEDNIIKIKKYFEFDGEE